MQTRSYIYCSINDVLAVKSLGAFIAGEKGNTNFSLNFQENIIVIVSPRFVRPFCDLAWKIKIKDEKVTEIFFCTRKKANEQLN